MKGVVLIDDNLRLARAAAEFLKDEEFGPIEVCVDLASAEAACPRMPLPHAVIADLQLPGVPPPLVLGRMRSLWAHSPLVGWSATDASDETKQLLDAFVHKAQAIHELVTLIRRLAPGAPGAAPSRKQPGLPSAKTLQCAEEIKELHRLSNLRDRRGFEQALHRLLGAAQWTGDRELESGLLTAREAVNRGDWLAAIQSMNSREF